MVAAVRGEFIQKSVVCHSETWLVRYQTAEAKLTTVIRSALQELGPLPIGSDPYERCNQWLLATVMAYGVRKVHFICLWNGNNGDGRGGTAHMYQEVNRQTGAAHTSQYIEKLPDLG